MPTIIIQANFVNDGNHGVTLTERLVAANLNSPHYTTQLIERLVWATADAEAVENSPPVSVADHKRGNQRPYARAPSRTPPPEPPAVDLI